MQTNENHDDRIMKHRRLVVRVVQGLLQREAFEHYTDLKDAICREHRRLRIPLDRDDLVWALDQLEKGGELSVLARPAPPPVVVDPDDAPVTPAQAHEALQRIRERLGLLPSPKRMPAVRQLDEHEVRALAFRRDQRRAFAQVQQQILDTAEHVAQLEAAIDKPTEDQ